MVSVSSLEKQALDGGVNFYLIPFLASSRRGIGELVNLSVFTVNIFIIKLVTDVKGFPGGLDSKESACNAGDLGSIPGLGRSPGEGNSYSLQYSGLDHKESDTTGQLSLSEPCRLMLSEISQTGNPWWSSS